MFARVMVNGLKKSISVHNELVISIGFLYDVWYVFLNKAVTMLLVTKF